MRWDRVDTAEDAWQVRLARQALRGDVGMTVLMIVGSMATYLVAYWGMR